MKNKLLLTLPIAVILCAALVACGNNTNETEPETTGTTHTTSDWLDIEEETGETLPNIENLTFTEFNNMPAEQQQEVMNTFETTDAFFEWYNEKVQDYQEYVEQQKNPTEETTNNETTETTVPNVSVSSSDKITYMDYHSMSADEQLAFIKSFKIQKDFVAWYNAAKQEYNDSLIELDGSTPIDIGEIIGSTEPGD